MSRYAPMKTADPTRDDLSPEYWRLRAAEVREAVKGIVHPKNKKILEQVARSYDEMANLLEQGSPSERLRPPHDI